MKRGLLCQATAIGCLAIVTPMAVAQTAPEITTSGGRIAGAVSPTGFVFKGVPYAAPPVGPLRWSSPAPVNPWEGVRAATSFAAPCAQAPLRGMTAVSDVSREDCLYLNVWTPRAEVGRKLPVMVWIHGGGFVNGSGTSPTYDGGQFAARGVIVVTINYRLGVFGFLAHPNLTAQSAHKSSGNYGLEDQVAALQWVQANIASFGGDPRNVTIFGQSAGGASVLNLTASPLAQGLFSKAIIQSGAARGAIAPTVLAQTERAGAAFVGRQNIAGLRALDTISVLNVVEAAPPGTSRFAPSIDGYVLTRDPMTVLSDRTAHSIPLLIGSNAREGLSTPEIAQFATTIQRAFGPNASRATEFYQEAGTDDILGTPEQQFATDTTFRCGAVEAAGRAASGRTPVWQYQFEQFVPGREAMGAAHSFEVPYVFGNLSSTGFSAANYTEADRRLSARMTDYWANFAKRGDPNGAGLPRWGRYTSESRTFLRFASTLPGNVQPASDLRGELCRLLPTSAPARGD